MGLAVATLATVAHGATTLPGGDIATSTWNNSGSPYLVQGSITVPTGNILTIDATGGPVAVKFALGTGLTVNGHLQSNGTTSDGVVLTSILDDTTGTDDDGTPNTVGTPGDWLGVEVVDGTITASWTVVRYGGSSTPPPCDACGNLRISDTSGSAGTAILTSCLFADSSFAGVFGDTGAQITLTDSTISDNGSYGFLARSGATIGSVTGNTFGDNGNFAAAGIPIELLSAFTGNTFVNLANPPGRYLAIESAGGTVTGTHTWVLNSGAVYVLTGDVSYVGGAWTIEEGVQVKMGPDVSILVDVTTVAVGQAAGQAVVFTSLKDDDTGGDTNGDGSATTPAAGDWDHVRFEDDNDSGSQVHGILNNAWFRYGGSGGIANVFIDGYYTGLTFNDCRFEQSAAAGFRIDGYEVLNTPNINATLNGGRIAENATYGMHYTTWGHALLDGVTFENNGDFSLYGMNLDNLVEAQNLVFNPTPQDDRNIGFYVSSMAGDGSSGRLTGAWPDEAPIVIAGTGAFPRIYNSATITVPAGAIIKFDAGRGLLVDHAAFNVGTPAGSEVLFTSLLDDTGGDTNGDGSATTPAAGDWDHVRFEDDNDSGSQVNGTVENTRFDYGGSGGLGNVYVDGYYTDLDFIDCSFVQSSSDGARFRAYVFGAPINSSIDGCVFRNNSGGGLVLENSARPPISNSDFGDNGGFSISGLRPEYLDSVALSNTFSNTDHSGMSLAIAFTDGNVDADTVWDARNASYVLMGNVTVANTATLTIAPDVTVKMAPHSWLRCEGTLHALGSQIGPVVLTSLADDAAFGDTNGDGNATLPAPGDWETLTLAGAGQSVLRHLNVHYGSLGALNLEAGTTVDIEDARFEHNIFGISCDGAGSGIVATSIFSNNDEGVHVESCPNLVLSGDHNLRNSFSGNVTWAVSNADSAGIVNATHNYWGHRLGPTHATSAGSGDPVTDYVDFDPFVTVTANAGADHYVTEGLQDVLDGRASFDPDGFEVAFAWTQVSGQSVVLQNAATARPRFIAPAVDSVEDLIFSLVVSVEGVFSNPDTVVVTVIDSGMAVPTAKAGPDQLVNGGDTVFLDGSLSFDSDGAIMTFFWEQTEGIPVTLSDETAEVTTFVGPPSGPIDEALVFNLTVMDDDGLYDSDTLIVTLTDGPVPVELMSWSIE